MTFVFYSAFIKRCLNEIILNFRKYYDLIDGGEKVLKNFPFRLNGGLCTENLKGVRRDNK